MWERNGSNVKAGNALCSVCVEGTADMPCTSPETFLCVKRTPQCQDSYFLAYYHVPGYAEGSLAQFPVVRTTTSYAYVKEFTREVFDTICKENSEESQTMKAELSRDVEAALAEVENTLMEDKPRLTSRYGGSIRALAEHFQSFHSFNTSTVAVVTFSCQLPHVFAAIGISMKMYNFNTNKTTQQQLPTVVESGYIHVDRTTVLILGKQVLTVDLFTLQITTLAPLLTPRNHVSSSG